LVLPEGHEKMVLAMVNMHASASRRASEKESKQQHEDLVRGKGKGMIILLHGEPGVGKTSTAECVAAHTGRPLFPITCGE
jgi:MoxR-like ATPase